MSLFEKYIRTQLVPAHSKTRNASSVFAFYRATTSENRRATTDRSPTRPPDVAFAKVGSGIHKQNRCSVKLAKSFDHFRRHYSKHIQPSNFSSDASLRNHNQIFANASIHGFRVLNPRNDPRGWMPQRPAGCPLRSLLKMTFLLLILLPAFVHPTAPNKKPPTCGGISISQLNLQEINEHNTGWHMYAERSCFNKNGQVITCDHVICSLKTAEENIAHVRAQHSIVKRNKKIIHLIGAVTGSFKTLTFSSHDVDYTFSTHLLKTKKRTRYSHPLFTLEAKKSTIDLRKKKIFLRGGITSEIRLAASDSTCTDHRSH